MKIDITLEFYHKNATYKSIITGGLTKISIKKVEVNISNTSILSGSKYCHCIITSDKGIEYNLESLTFN